MTVLAVSQLREIVGFLYNKKSESSELASASITCLELYVSKVALPSTYYNFLERKSTRSLTKSFHFWLNLPIYSALLYSYFK